MSQQARTSLMSLAESWALEAGTSLSVRGTPDEHKLLTHPDATVRALWRCALQLADSVRGVVSNDDQVDDT